MPICLQQNFCANHKTTRNNFSILVEPLGFKTKKEELRPLFNWRREGDSNSRWARAHDGFQDRCIKPLCHLSIA